MAGGLLGLLRVHERHPERVDESAVDDLTEACLRLLGLRAAKLGASPDFRSRIRRAGSRRGVPPCPTHDPVGAACGRSRLLRARVPRRTHAEWRPPADRPDPVEVLFRTNEGRLPELVPVRHGRMMESPFAYFITAAPRP